MKKATAIILIFGLLAAILISCGDKQGEDAQQNGGNEPLDANAMEKEADQEKEPEFSPIEGIDYGGYNFRLLGFDGKATGTWQSMEISEVLSEQETGEPINDAVYKRNRIVEDLYNIEIGIVPVTYPNRDDFATIANRAIMAGDDLFDAALLLGRAFPTILSKKNMTHDLWSIASLDLKKSWWDQNSSAELSIGGKLNCVIGDINLYSSFAPIVIYANKQLIEDYAVENLYQLVRDGKWTWDKLHDIAKSVTVDLNGDGVINRDDQVGLSTQYVYLYNAITSAGEVMTPKEAGDIPVLSPNMSRVSALIDKIVPIFKDKESAIIGDEISGYNNVYFDFIMPKFRDGGIMFLVQQMLVSFELRRMEADFAILPFPKYDENQANYRSVITDYFATFTIIPITCTDVERSANVLQAMGYYSQQYITPAFYDVTVTSKLMRDEDSIEMIDIILSNRLFDLSFYYDWGGIATIFNNMVQRGTNTLTSDFEKNESKINAAIQKTLDELMGS